MAQRKPPNTPAEEARCAPARRRTVRRRRPAPSRDARRLASRASRSSTRSRRPWGLIITTIVLVLFAGGIVAYAVTRSSGNDSSGVSAANKPYVVPEIAAAKKIKGVIYKKEPNHNHVTTTVKYDTSPPIGGNHNPIWADCTGTVYKTQIANENAVHMLEHGAVWITYNPKTATAADIKRR